LFLIAAPMIRVPAQTPPTLAARLYAGINVTGTVGAAYRIEAVVQVP
jgi:hypothetical protein